MDSPVNTPALEMLDTVNFKVVTRGYSRDEVDAFLDQAEIEAKNLLAENSQLKNQLRLAATRIAELETLSKSPATTPAPTPSAPARPSEPAVDVKSASDKVSAMIAMAHEFVSKTEHEALEKAKQLREQAAEDARRLIEEAKTRAMDELAQLEGRKRRLSEQVETLDAFVQRERTRLRTLMGDYVDWIEKSFALQEHESPRHVAPTPASPTTPPAPVTPTHTLAPSVPPSPPAVAPQEPRPSYSTAASPVAPTANSTQQLPVTPPSTTPSPSATTIGEALRLPRDDDDRS